MPLWEIIQNDKVWSAIAGIAGAAAIAATDWSKPWRFAQHVGVGTLCATFATPVLYPAIAAMLGWINVDPNYQYAGASFVVGALGIYVLEFVRAVIQHRTKGHRDE